MLKIIQFLILTTLLTPVIAVATEPLPLSESSYKPDLAIILIQLNWGRVWKCGQFENAQLQALTFTKSPLNNAQAISLDLETPSKLFSDNKFLPYAFVLEPGEYLLTGFDVKIARSASNVAHIKGTKENLIKEGTSTGGTFNVNPGEVIYIGHFGLDCAAEPFLWRYYIDGREEFEKYVTSFRQKYPFLNQTPVQYRLFSTKTLGIPFSLDEPVIK